MSGKNAKVRVNPKQKFEYKKNISAKNKNSLAPATATIPAPAPTDNKKKDEKKQDDNKNKKPDIQRIKITLHTNLPDTSNATFDLTRKNLLFPYLDNKSLLKFENYPLLCTNAKYVEDKLSSMLFHKRYEVFFNWSSFTKFIENIDVSTDIDINKRKEIIEHNVKIMIKYLFPVSYPAYRSVKYISDPNSNFNIVDSALSVFKTRTENLYLNVNSKDYTVDEVTVLDTLDSNPSYMGLRNQLNEYFIKLPDATKYVEKMLDKELANKTFQTGALRDTASKFVELYKNESTDSKIILEYFNFINSGVIGKLSTDDSIETTANIQKKDNFLKAARLAIMIKTMYQKPQNTILDNKFSLSSIDYNQKEIIFRGPNGIVDSLKDYYYPERISLNQDIAKCFDMFADSADSNIQELYETTDEFRKVIDMEELQKLLNDKTEAFVDNIKIGTRDTQPRYQVNLRVSLTEGVIVDPNWHSVKCDYNNNKIGAKINQNYYKLPNPEMVDLKGSIEKYEKSAEKTKGKGKDKDKEKTEKKMVIFRPEGMDAVKTDTGAAETSITNVTASVAVPVQKKEKEIKIPQDIITELSTLVSKTQLKNNNTLFIQDKFNKFVENDDKIKEYFVNADKFKTLNPLDKNKDDKTNKTLFELENSEIKSYLNKLYDNNQILLKQPGLNTNDKNTLDANSAFIEILLKYIDETYLQNSGFSGYFKSLANSTRSKTTNRTYNYIQGGSRTKKRSNRRLHKTKKRRQ